MKTTILRLLFALLLVFMLLTSQSVRSAYAASYVVNSLGDAVVNDSACTLREAILAANNAPANANCGAGSAADDTITFSVSGAITLGSTLPSIVSGQGTLTINGGGNITISGNNAVRVMVVNSGANLTLQNLTIANGNTSGSGGGIFSAGTLNVTNSTFFNNSAAGGGGIFNNFNGTLTVTDSTFSNNSASSDNGGGILNAGTLNVSNSTFSANSANFGGGIFNNGTLNVSSSTFSTNSASAGGGGGIYNGFLSTLNVSNSTFANNSANSSLGGGGIFNDEGTLNVTNSSFSGNSAPFGGGIRIGGGTATLNNTLIANSISGGDCVTSVSLSGANINNLIEDSTNACGLVNGVNGNIIGSDPNLGALTGSPAYFPLNPGSLAIDAGDNTTCANPPVNNQSQNGATRPQDGDDADSIATCDIGSYEAIFPKLTATKTNTVGGAITLGNSFTWTVTVANTGIGGATFAVGQTILRDDLPAGATYGAPTVQNLVGVSGSGSITCNMTSNVLICYAGGGPVTLGATAGQFDVVFSVTPTAAGALTNPAYGGVCRADPFGAIAESSESNNDCADTVTVDGIPDLTAAKSNNVGGTITAGNSFTWTVTVANSGNAAATFASGQTILQDNLPGGPSYGAPTVQNLVNVSGSGSITCHITFSMLTCTASGGSVTLGATTGAFDVVFSVTPTAAGALTNPASGGVCRTDPDNNIIESSEINNDCADTVTVGGIPDLTAAKSNTVGGAITLGNSFTWTATVANSGNAAATFTSGQTILQDNLPGGPTYGAPTVQNIVNVTNSSNISCTIASNVLICYASGGPVTLGATTGAFDVAFSVTPTAAGALTNPASGGVCRADPNGAIAESSESNNDCADTVTVGGVTDLTAIKINNVSGAITLGNPFTWTVSVTNTGTTGATFVAGQTILRDDLPSGPAYGTPTVQNAINVSGSIGCTIASNVLICTASGGSVTLGATTGAFDVAFSVTPTLTGALTNPASGGICRADPNGAITESSESNNDCADTVTVGGVPDLAATKSNNVGGAITLGNSFTWTVSVTNTGAAGATFTSGQTILQDNLPGGPTYGAPTVQNLVNVSGSGSITCNITFDVLMCYASGGAVTLGAFDVAFSVTPTLTGALTNPASGGICRADPDGAITESSESNNDCADTVTVGGVPDLTAAKSNNAGGVIMLGNSFTWTVTVVNSGTAGATFAAGQTILRNDLPAGATYGAPTVQNLVNVSGSGSIACAISSGTLTCTATGGPVMLGATTGAFDVDFSVTPNAAGALTNPTSGGVCRADPDNVIVESSESNNDCADTVTVNLYHVYLPLTIR